MLTESWVEGKSVEEKDAQPTERTAALWGLSSKIDSRIWLNFTRNGLRLGSRHQESPHTDVSRNLATVVIRGVLPGLRRRRTGLLPSGPKSSFQMIWGCNVICWCWSIVFFENQRHCTRLPIFVYQMCTKFLSTSCFLLLTSFLKMLIWFSSRIWHLPTLPKAPKVGSMTMVLCAWLASKLTRPEPHREYMGYCQEEKEKQETKKCRWAEGHCQRNLGFHTTSAVPQTDHLHATPNWGSN